MNMLVEYINNLQERCHEISMRHGFWDDKDIPSPTTQALATFSFELKRLSDCVELQRLHAPSFQHGGFLASLSLIQIHALSRIVLIASELGETIDAVLRNDWPEVAHELADVHIRAFDLAGGLQFNTGEALLETMAKNELRPYKHGKLA